MTRLREAMTRVAEVRFVERSVADKVSPGFATDLAQNVRLAGYRSGNFEKLEKHTSTSARRNPHRPSTGGR